MNIFPKKSAVVCAITLVALVACSPKADVAATGASGAAQLPASAAPGANDGRATTPASGPPVTVTTVRAQKKDLPVLVKATGTVVSLNSVDVKSQVTTVVSKVHIQEGQFVKRGDLMFTLDSRPDEANLAKAQAQLAKDLASLADAERQYLRAKQLVAQNFVSQGALDTNTAQVDGTNAAVAADRAALDSARIALSYGRVTAPHSGRAGAITVFAGSAVQANVTTLVTITQLDPIAVAFNLPQRNLPDALAALKDGGAAVSAALADGSGRFDGRLKFVDNSVDANSGTVKVKAVFENPAGKLWPGAYVEISQTASTLKDALVVPQAAIIQGARGPIVYVMEGGKANLKPVKVLYAQDELAAITGVQPGDAIVLDGRQNLRPGSAVVERKRDAAPSAGADRKPAAATGDADPAKAAAASAKQGLAP